MKRILTAVLAAGTSVLTAGALLLAGAGAAHAQAPVTFQAQDLNSYELITPYHLTAGETFHAGTTGGLAFTVTWVSSNGGETIAYVSPQFLPAGNQTWTLGQ